MIYQHAHFLIILLSTYFQKTLAQSSTIAPANVTYFSGPDRQLVLVTSLTDNRYKLDPLTNETRFINDQTSDIKGTLVLSTNPAAAQQLRNTNIAFLGCDPSLYTGPINSARTLDYAVEQNPIAIILYSVSSSGCSFTPSSDFGFKYLYSLAMPESESHFVDALIQHQSIDSTITLQSRSDNNGTSDTGPFTKSPTTAVAMIILYSITGIITALFLVIIVVGAIRAHRHPERYGPRHVLGRPRQSRAKGIARAMLETIPIVKFGDKDEDKPATQARDIELGSREQRPPAVPEVEGSSTDGQAQEDADSTGPEIVKTETAAGTSQHTEGEAGLNAGNDNGLACSVCTDDFVKGQDIRVLPCNHKFHPECIDPWLLNVSGTCPLCRVDLRPTTTHPDSETLDGPSARTHVQPSVYDLLSVPPPSNSLTPPEPSASRAPNRRSRTGLSLYIQNTLNSRRMRDATPEERIAALRDLRSARHADSGSAEPRSRNRLSSRLSRAWMPNSRPSSGINNAPPDAAELSEVSNERRQL